MQNNPVLLRIIKLNYAKIILIDKIIIPDLFYMVDINYIKYFLII